MIVLGVAITVVTIAHAGLSFTNGILLGPLFCLAGAGRLYVSRRPR